MSDFAKHSVEQFLGELASSSPTPGGGTAAALAGAFGASLVEMVASLTLSKEKFAAVHEVVAAIAETARTARSDFTRLAQEDARAYDAVVASRRLPKETPDQIEVRSRRLAEANRRATEIPMQTARVAVRLMEAVPELVEKGNPSAASDAGSAAVLLEAATVAALLNVSINLPGVKDPDLTERLNRETVDLTEQSTRLRSQILATVRGRF